ncbi:aldo/keto reductase [Echinicola pacifica]|uniref:Aldo/keto reductase n=1 Tax=Echinicola pacifica TaxID=346377 RepID=A0A918Q1Q8_9BACT|nr:aldo/keto reductase [Echinicola pacifica]GGZ30708.1 aldo/keto reductase [Echinicola pacifica]
MKYRALGDTGMKVSEISLGTWQLGGGWGGNFDAIAAHKILSTAVDQGINFFDTADVYDNGLSEEAIGRFLKTTNEEIFVATKCGRHVSPHVNEGYTVALLRKFVEESLRNMDLDTLDLVQLHCPPTEVYERDEIFELFDKLKEEGKIQNLGVSVEKVEEAQRAIQYPNVKTIQIIFNMFRQKPAEEFFKTAKEKNIGIISRVPLASGLLTGKLRAGTEFDEKDHRNFNRNGEAFDKGETFSGVDYSHGLKAVEVLKEKLGKDHSLVEKALKWILMHEEVSTVIPGASSPEQVIANAAVSDASGLSKEEMNAVSEVYQEWIREEVHSQW